MKKRKLSANILFSGMGCQETALGNIFDLDVLSTSEIDCSAIVLYAEIHHGLTTAMVRNYDRYPDMDDMVQELTDKNIGFDPENRKPFNWIRQEPELVRKVWLAVHLNRNHGDICKIKKLPYADLWTVSFPCTDISCAGKMKGFAQNSDTRSALLWQQIRLLEQAVKTGESPMFLIFENVKNLVGQKFRDDFDALLNILSDLGFRSYWKILNARDYGTPQNRERVYVVCIRKDLDNGTFRFPEPVGLKMSLDDILDPGHAKAEPEKAVPGRMQPAAGVHNNPAPTDFSRWIPVYPSGTSARYSGFHTAKQGKTDDIPA